MTDRSEESLLDVLLDAWDRGNRILIGLLRALPEGGLEVRATESGPTVAELLGHMHHERLVSVSEEAPEAARPVPAVEWAAEHDRERLAEMLSESAAAVRAAVKGRVVAGRDLDLHYDHPILLIQLLLWHEAYHHGQIKLALKLAGMPIPDADAGRFSWNVWRARDGQKRR